MHMHIILSNFAHACSSYRQGYRHSGSTTMVFSKVIPMPGNLAILLS